MSRGCLVRIALAALTALAYAQVASANPYLAKPGETPVKVRAAACAISGGFSHLYSALDFGLGEGSGK
jgi:hypothetical protein